MRIIPSLVSIVFILSLANLLYGQDSLSHYSIQQLDSVFQVHKKAEAFGKLYPYAQAALTRAEEEYGTKDTLYAKGLYKLGFAVDYGLGDMEQAMSYYEQALAIQRKQIPKSIDCANTILVIGDIYNYNWGQYKKAESLYLEVMGVLEEKEDKEDAIYATVLNSLGNLYDGMGRIQEAKKMLFKALSIRKKILGQKHTDYASSLNNLAGVYEKIGKKEDAEALYLEAIEVRKSLSQQYSMDYAGLLNNIAGLYGEMGRYQQSESLYLEAIGILKQVLGKRHYNYAVFLNNLGTLYEKLGRYEEAIPLYLESIKIGRHKLGRNHPNYAAALNNLGVLYKKTGDYRKAEPLDLEAHRIWKKRLGEKHPRYAHSLNNLGGLYEMMGRYRKAEHLFLEAKEIRKEVVGEYDVSYITSWNNLAELYKKTEDYDKAWSSIEQALMANVKGNISLNISQTWADSLAGTKYSSYNHIGAMLKTLIHTYALLSIDSNESNKNKQLIVSELAMRLLKISQDSYFGQENKLFELSKSNNWMLTSLRLLDKETQVAKAFQFAEQSKSVLLMQATKAEQAYSLGDLPDSLVRKEKVLHRKHAKLEASLVKKRLETEKDSLRKVLNALNQEIDIFQKRIEKDYPRYANLKYEQTDASVEDIQALLDEKSALVEYVVGDSVVYIFYVDKNNLRLIEFFVDNNVLKNKIKQFHNVLRNYSLLAKKEGKSYQEYTKLAYGFYKNLLESALSNAKGIEHLIFVTDGELGHLPFEAFLVEPAPQSQTSYANLHYLLNDYSVSYNYSATLWKESMEQDSKQNNNGQILGMAASYDFSQDSLEMGERLPVYKRLRKELGPLPAATNEVEVLAENFNGFFCLNTMSSEEIFKEKAANYSVIHLAMHGLLDSQHPILSSLVFTEDGGSKENNFLQAYEISKMNLNADLVVLSACETGYGKFEQGNGIASLARAFMYAGASSLVVSLWQVNDYATSELMKSFYQNLVTGVDKAEALRQAKLAYIKSAKGIAKHPAFWSSFIQIGDSRSISVASKGGLTWGWMIGGVVLLLGVVAFLRKRLSYNE